MDIILSILAETLWITVVGIISLSVVFGTLVVGGITIFTPVVLRSEIMSYYEKRTARMSPYEIRAMKHNTIAILLIAVGISIMFGDFIVGIAQTIIPLLLILGSAFMVLVIPPLIKILNDEKKDLDPYKQRVIEGYIRFGVIVAVAITLFMSII